MKKLSFLRYLGFLLLGWLCAVPRPSNAQSFSWKITNGPANREIRSILAPPNGDIIIGGKGLYRTRDFGHSWQQLSDSNYRRNDYYVGALALDSSARILAGVSTVLIAINANFDHVDTLLRDYVLGIAIMSQGQIVVAGSTNVWVSSDNGVHWKARSNALQTGLTDLKVAPNGSLFATTSSGIYRSRDTGSSWQRLLNGLPNEQYSSLAITGNGDIYAAGGSVYLSQDDGENFANVDTASVDRSNPMLLVARTSDGAIFEANNTRSVSPYRISHDHGRTWRNQPFTLSSPLPNASQAVACDAQGNWLIAYLGERAEATGALLRATQDTNWSIVGAPTSFVGSCIADREGRIFAAVDTAFLVRLDSSSRLDSYHSDDGNRLPLGQIFLDSLDRVLVVEETGLYLPNDSTLWKPLLNNLSGAYTCAMTGTNGFYFVVVAGSLYFSADAGAHWDQLNQGLSDVHVLSITTTLQRGALVAGSDSAIYRSTDNGFSWTQVTPKKYPIPHLWTSTTGELFASSNQTRAFRSVDAGITWDELDSGIDAPFTCMISDAKGNMYAGTHSGVLFLKRGGNVWVPLDSGLNNHDILSLTRTPDGTIVAGTKGSGIYLGRGDVSTLSAAEPPQRLRSQTLTNYPNPVNSTTLIRFELEHAARIRIELFDQLGKLVRLLDEASYSSGEHQYLFDATDLSNGVYFIRLSGSGKSQPLPIVIKH